MLRSLATTTTLLVAAVALPAPAGAATTAARTPQVRITGSNAAFSPNHDGSKDVAVVRYGLTRRADVTVQVSNGLGTVLLQHVGRIAAGTHYFRWNGTRGGKVVADGNYAVSVLARRSKRATPWVARTPLTVDARYAIGSNSVRLSSGTVYPRTTVIRDAVVGNLFPHNPSSAPKLSYYTSARMQVRDPHGKVVDTAVLAGGYNEDDPSAEWSRQTSCAAGCGRFTWDGRRSDGQVAAAGRYRVRVVQGADRAGNPRILAPEVGVTVSSQRLVARTESQTMPAAAFERLDISPTCQQGCRDSYGGPTSSHRFDGGLSFDSATPTCPVNQYGFAGSSLCQVGTRFVIPFTGRRTPADRMSVTAHGGPPTAGGTGAGVLSAGGSDRSRAAQMQGDSNTLLLDASFASTTEVPLPGRPSGIQWEFDVTRGAPYDLASFDVSWTTYVLP